MPDSGPIIREARASDLPAIAAYLAPRLGGHGGAARYRRFLEYEWLDEKPNLGTLIEDAGKVGGFLGAIYSRRVVRGREHLVCNINSWHVEDRFRKLSLRMMNELLARPGCTFTCFSPSEQVVEVLQFFKFRRLDSGKVIFAPISGLTGLLRRPRARVFWGDDVVRRLNDTERRIVHDHRSYRCGHFLIERDGERSYFVTVRRGRGARAFADVLYASDPQLLAECIAQVHLPIALTHGTFLTGIDRRLLRRRPATSFLYRGLRPLMFLSEALGPDDVDALYSEFVPMYG